VINALVLSSQATIDEWEGNHVADSVTDDVRQES